MAKKTMKASAKSPTTKANVKPEAAPAPEIKSEHPVDNGTKGAGSIGEQDIKAAEEAYARADAEADEAERAEYTEAEEGPMGLADVNAILADNYPGYVPIDPRGDATGLTFTLPDGKSLKVERKRVKACANMEELREYVGSLAA